MENNIVKEAIYYSGISFRSVAKKLELRPSSFIKRVNNCSFTIEEQKRIAKAIGCSNYVFKFVNVDGTAFNGNTLKEIVKKAAEYREVSLAEIGEKLFYSRQNFCQRLKRGKFSEEELEKIAKYLGCRYVKYFEFHNWERF